MNKLKRVVNGNFIIVLFAMLAVSCSLKDVSISSIDGVSVSELKSNSAEILVKVTVKNENTSKVVLKKADLDILLNDKYIGKAALLHKVIIPSSSKNQIEIPISISSEQPLTMLVTKLGISTLFGASKVRINGEVKGSMNLIPHKIMVDEIQELSLDQLKELVK